jgi:hypothetical protein
MTPPMRVLQHWLPQGSPFRRGAYLPCIFALTQRRIGLGPSAFNPRLLPLSALLTRGISLRQASRACSRVIVAAVASSGAMLIIEMIASVPKARMHPFIVGFFGMIARAVS